MDRLTSIEVFIRIVELGSLARAAEASDLSAGMVGKHLRALEERLGVRLLLRSTRKIAMTGAGRAYYERCRCIVADMEEADREAANEHVEPQGLLRISAPVMFGGLHMAGAVAAFHARHPLLAIQVTSSNRYVDLTDGEFDMAIRVGRMGEEDLVVRQFAVCTQITCAAPAYLQTRGTPVVPDELRQHECLINLHEQQPNLWTFVGGNQSETVAVKGAIRSDSALLLRGAAVAGAGIVRMPSFMLSDDLNAGRLVPILGTYAERAIGIQAVSLPSNSLSMKVRLFAEFLVEHFGAMPPWG